MSKKKFEEYLNELQEKSKDYEYNPSVISHNRPMDVREIRTINDIYNYASNNNKSYAQQEREYKDSLKQTNKDFLNLKKKTNELNLDTTGTRFEAPTLNSVQNTDIFAPIYRRHNKDTVSQTPTEFIEKSKKELKRQTSEYNKNIKKSEELKDYNERNDWINAVLDYSKNVAKNNENTSDEGKYSTPFLSGLENALIPFQEHFKTEDGEYVSLPTYNQLRASKFREDSDSSIYNAFSDVSQSVGNMVPGLAAGAISGGLGSAAFFANTFTTARNQALLEGYDGNSASSYALVNASLELGVGKLLGGASAIVGKSPVAKAISNKLTSKFISNPILSSFTSDMISEFGEEYVQEWLDPKVKSYLLEHKSIGESWNSSSFIDKQNLYAGFLGAMSAGIMNTPSAARQQLNLNNQIDYMTQTAELEKGSKLTDAEKNSIKDNFYREYNKNLKNSVILTENEQKVVDREVKKRIDEFTNENKELTSKEKNKIEEEVRKDLEKGRISIDTIEEALGDYTYDQYKDVLNKKNSIQEKINEYKKMKDNDITVEQREDYNRLKDELSNLDENSYKNQLSKYVDDLTKNDSYLRTSYNERANRSVSYQNDLSKYSEKQQKIIQKAIDSGVLNNTNRSHEMVDLVAKLAEDKDMDFDFVNNEKIKDTGFALEGKQVNGYNTGTSIGINIDSNKALNSVIGHEITHVLEGTDLYDNLQKSIIEYAKTKGEYDTRLKELQELYKDVKDANVENELTSDLVGDYLFTDEDFVNRLYSNNRSVFQKIYDEIKYLVKIVSPGSKESKQLEKVKHAFEKAYNQKNTNTKESVKYSAIGIKQIDKSLKNNNLSERQKEILNKIKNNYNEALKIEKKSTNEEIHSKTGWYKDPKGKWHFEITDKYAGFKIKPEANKVYKLGDLLNHELLYNIDPKLKNVKVQFDNIKSNGKFTGYPGFRKIVINNNLLPKGSKTTLNTLLHEIQHKLQLDNNFDYGASSGRTLQDMVDYVNNLGEIEATNTSKRINMSQKELIESLPELAKKNPTHFYKQELINKRIKDIANNQKNGYNNSKRSTNEESISNISKNKNENINDNSWNGLRTDNSSFSNDNNIKFSVSVGEANTGKSNNGVELSKAQQEYFKNSKATDEEGNLITVYHTTTNEGPQFNEFNPVGTEYYRFGDQVVNYFTDSKDMSGSYASQDYIMADTKKITSMKEVEDYIKTMNILGWGSQYNYELVNEDGKYKLIDNSKLSNSDKTSRQIYEEANEYKKTLTENELKQFKDMFEHSSDFRSDGRYNIDSYLMRRGYEFGSEEDKIAQKYLNIDNKSYEESGIYWDALMRNAKYHSIATFNSEQDLFRNLKREGSASAKRQYEGYVNITNPYIVDAEKRNWNQVVQQSNEFIDELEERVPQDIKDKLTRLYQESANKSAEAREKYNITQQVINGIWNSAVDEEVKKVNDVVKNVGFDNIEQVLYDVPLGVNGWYNLAESLEQNGLIGSATKTYIIDEFKLPSQVKELLEENYNKEIPVHQLRINDITEAVKQLNRKTTLKDIYNKNFENYEEFDKYRMPNSYFMEQLSAEGNGDILGNELNDIFETRAEIKGPYAVGEEIAQAASVGFSKSEMIRLWGTSKTTNDIVKEIIASNKDGTTNYDGLIIKNVYDYGGKSATGTQANDLYVTFNSNQFKAIDNENPTNDSDIRYSLSEQNKKIAPVGNYQIKGKDVKLEKIAPVKETTKPIIPTKEIPKNPTKETSYDNEIAKKPRKDVQKELLDEMGITVDDISVGNDISSIQFQRTDPIRLNEKVFGAKIGKKINDATINKTKHNEAERIRFLKNEREEIKNLGIKPGSKESEAVQKYAEKQYITEKGQVKTYDDNDLAAEFKDKATRDKIRTAAKVLREKYDNYIDSINKVITDLGYDEIPKRKDYMRHFQELNDKLSKWGIPLNPTDMSKDVLPTDINGVTDQFRPGKNWFASAMHREGLRTVYDAITGIDGYLESASNLIYHTGDIQRYRTLSKLIRDTYGQSHGLDDINLDTVDGQQRLKDVYDNKLSKYAAWIDEQANSLAGKKGAIDRGAERVLGRKLYNVLDAAKKQVGSNMTGFNVRSALTNFASAVQGASKINKASFIKGTISTFSNMIHNDGLINKSDFLTNRFGSDQLSKKLWQKASNAGQILMTGSDYFTANQIWRSKYFENLSKGMNETDAIKNADDFASRIMGDRSKGSTAEIFNSKTLGLLTQFQLEVNNQWSSIVHDNKMDIQNGNKSGASVLFQLGQLSAMSYFFNGLMKSLTGSDVMIDPFEMFKKLIGSDDDEKTFEERATEVIGDLVDNLPFASIMNGGRIPLSEAFKGAETFTKKITGQKDKYGNEIKWNDVKKDLIESGAYWLLPTGYGQFRKTKKGLSMYDENLPLPGSYTDSGNLRFTADNTTKGKIKSALFGQYANEEAQKYIDSGYETIKSQDINLLKDLGMNSSQFRDFKQEMKNNTSTTINKNDIKYSKYVDDDGNNYWYDKDNKELYDESFNLSSKNVTDLKKVTSNELLFDYIKNANFTEEGKQILLEKYFTNNTTDKYGYIKYTDEKNHSYWYDDDKDILYDSKYNVVIDKTKEDLKRVAVEKDMSNYKDYGSYEEADFALKNPEKYLASKLTTNNFKNYKKYVQDIANFTSDKDDEGKTIKNSRKEKVLDYINNLNENYGSKIILYKMTYPSDNEYNYDIVEFLNNKNNITEQEERKILEYLGMKVDEDGNVRW